MGGARELGHGIHYLRDELAAYSDDEIERAIAQGELAPGEVWSHLEMLLSTLGDDLNVDLDDPVVELASREWVAANHELLALREGSSSPVWVEDDSATPGKAGVMSGDLTLRSGLDPS